MGEQKRGSAMRFGWGVVGGLAIAMALGGCMSDPEPEEVDIVAGAWLSPGGARTTFAGGTWTVDTEEDSAFDGGTYTIDGNRLTMTTVHGGAFEVGDITCADGAVGVYDVSVADDGSSMEMVLVSDECEARAGEAGTQAKAE